MDKEFDKYRTIGPDYHYRQIDKRSIRNYNASVDARIQKLVENIERIAKDKKLKLLDVGCGDGVALNLLQKMPNLDLYGIDSSEEALTVAREKNPHAKLTHGNVSHLDYPDETFDIVISSDVIEHIIDSNKMLEEIKRVAKPNAVIIIGTPIRRTRPPIDPHHVEEFFKEDFVALMSHHFKDCVLHESHNLVITLLYNAPTTSFLNFKYFVNLLSLILNYNPFLAERDNASQMFAYMYVICRK